MRYTEQAKSYDADVKKKLITAGQMEDCLATVAEVNALFQLAANRRKLTADVQVEIDCLKK